MKRTVLFIFACLNILFAHAQVITRAQAIADLNGFDATLQEVHYNPYLYISKAGYAQKLNDLKQALPDSIDVKAFLLKISELTASLNDGHSMPVVVQPVFQSDFRKPVYFPVAVYADQDKQLYATENHFGIPPQAKLLSINDLNVHRFYLKTLNLLGGLPAFKTDMGARLLSNTLYYNNILPPFKVTYSVNGKTNTVILKEGLTLKESLT